MYKYFFLCAISFLISQIAFSDEVVWKGQVSADGTPTKAINLKLDEKYQIIAKGYVNLGKWIEAGQKLGEDPSYEFNAPSGPERLKTLMNSNDIHLDDKKYNPDHIYKSAPFIAKQNKIHFWVHDTDYDNNNGNFDVEIIKIKE